MAFTVETKEGSLISEETTAIKARKAAFDYIKKAAPVIIVKKDGKKVLVLKPEYKEIT